MFKALVTKNTALTERRLAFITKGYATISGHLKNRVGSVQASLAERQDGRLTERNLEIAVRHVLRDGLVVVENAIEHDHLDRLNKKMVEDAYYLAGRGEAGPFNYNRGNLQQDAPPIRKFFEPSIFLSK